MIIVYVCHRPTSLAWEVRKLSPGKMMFSREPHNLSSSLVSRSLNFGVKTGNMSWAERVRGVRPLPPGVGDLISMKGAPGDLKAGLTEGNVKVNSDTEHMATVFEGIVSGAPANGVTQEADSNVGVNKQTAREVNGVKDISSAGDEADKDGWEMVQRGRVKARSHGGVPGKSNKPAQEDKRRSLDIAKKVTPKKHTTHVPVVTKPTHTPQPVKTEVTNKTDSDKENIPVSGCKVDSCDSTPVTPVVEVDTSTGDASDRLPPTDSDTPSALPAADTDVLSTEPAATDEVTSVCTVVYH